MAVKDLLTKKPFYRLANGGKDAQEYNKPQFVDQMKYTERRLQGCVMTQADYLEEYYPFAHRVMSDFYFPEFYNYTERTGEDGKTEIEWNREETFRIGSTLQCVITCQQLVHETAGDTVFEITDENISSEIDNLQKTHQKAWLTTDSDNAFYKLRESVKETADGALVYFIYDKKVYIKRLSYLDGDTLFPHYDMDSGELTCLARKFSSYDEKGEEIVAWVEVWDEKYLYRYKQAKNGIIGIVNTIKDFFGLEGYELVYRKEHGFSRCPVVYQRDKDNGPCWNMVQPLIDDYEVALSYFAKNNAGAALPSYKMKGDDIDIQGDPLGRIRAFTMGKDDDVSIIQPNGLSENYTKYIEYLLNEIFQGAFIVKQPELKSGDTPTGTMKLYYAPSLDLAELACRDNQPIIRQMQSLLSEAYGIVSGKVTEMLRFDEHLYSYKLPFIHENTSSIIADLVSAKNAGIMSAETASERVPYNTNAEYKRRIVPEQKQQQQADRLYQLRTTRQQAAE